MSTALLQQPPLRKLDAWRHQLEAFHFAAERPAAMLAMDMGTGKTKVAIDLLANAGCRTILILCPKSVLGVWRREIERHWPGGCKSIVLDGGSTKSKAVELSCHFGATPHIVVINYDSAWRIPLGSVLLKRQWDAVVCDESHRIKAPGGRASRFCQQLGRIAPRRLCLTGTPMPHSPLDVYGQYRFLAPDIFGTSFTRFRARYAITHPQYFSQVRRWINQAELEEKFHSIAYVCQADDVLDLPETIDEEIPVTLSAKSLKVYGDLKNELVAEVDSGIVTVANALAKLLRLQQITSGFVGFTDDLTGEKVCQKLGDEKADALLDLLEDIDKPVVVFCRFRHDLDAVREVAQKLERRYGELSGRQRDLTDHAEMPEGIDIYGVQIQSGGVGIDLTRAHYAVYFSLSYNLGDYLQSRARLHRPGQTECVRFYHLVAERTVDQLIYKALEARQEVVESVLHRLKGYKQNGHSDGQS